MILASKPGMRINIGFRLKTRTLMKLYRNLIDLNEHQLERIKNAYGITAGELQFLVDCHARYLGTKKSLLQRLL